MIALTAFLAVRLLQLRESQCQPAQPCDTVLNEDEWQVLWTSTEHDRRPTSPPTLGWAYLALAKLGGFTDTKRTGRPGWDTLWHGWFRLLERVLRGEDGLTFLQLSKIASFFGRGVLFFLEPGPVDATQVHTPAFRTLANQKPELTGKLKRLIERVERQREIYLSLREELDNADLPRFKAPELPRDHPSKAARIARQWLGLAQNNTFDSYRAAVEARGVLVFRSNGYNSKWQIAKKSLILGFSLYDHDCPVIVVRKQDSESQQSFTLMQELGHVLLHQSSAIDDERDMQSHRGQERDANAFAGHLLVPDTFLVQVKDGARPRQISEFDEWLKALRKTWGVSTEVILRRLLDTDRLPQAQYAAYRAWRSTQTIPEQE